MTFASLMKPLGHSLIAPSLLTLSITTATASMAGAQTHDMHGPMPTLQSQSHRPTPQQSALVRTVKDATDRFRDVSKAIEAGYVLTFGCVSGGDYGAMGLHYVNFPLVGDGEIDATQPEIVLYEPLHNGRVRITGADFLVLAADWDAKHPNAGPPQLNGQLFHFFEAPNRFGLPPFYTLHVWAWKDNPFGTFTNWNPNVSCDAHNPPS
jgi:hypothetical protein